MSGTGLVSIHAPADLAETIANDGFFPAVDPNEARKAERITDTITPERLVYALANAMMSANLTLDEWKQTQIDDGYATLADVPDIAIGGVKRKHRLYLRAVYALAHADLIERYPDYSLTPAGERKSAVVTLAGDDHYRNAHWALSDIVGKSRTTVELI